MPSTPAWCRKATPVTVMCPVTPDMVDSLKATLRGLPHDLEKKDSPLVLNGRTHFGRWVVIQRLADEDGMASSDELSVPYLLFTSIIDGPVRTYFQALVEASPEQMHRIWSHCIGYEPGDDALVAYLYRNQIRTNLFFAPYARASLAKVRSVLDLRKAFIDFAVRTDGMEGDTLVDEFRAWYGDRAKKVSC
jgi:hypothetical protein